MFSCHRFSFFPDTSLEPVVNPTTNYYYYYLKILHKLQRLYIITYETIVYSDLELTKEEMVMD
jgi:hypothetical protein